jgi:hypothetical protein
MMRRGHQVTLRDRLRVESSSIDAASTSDEVRPPSRDIARLF